MKANDILAGLGHALVMIRVVRGVSQAELAERAGIRPNQVSRYETGQVLPQLPQLGRLLDALGIDVIDFFLFVAQVRLLVQRLDDAGAAEAKGEDAVAAMLRQLAARELDVRERVAVALETTGECPSQRNKQLEEPVP